MNQEIRVIVPIKILSVYNYTYCIYLLNNFHIVNTDEILH